MRRSAGPLPAPLARSAMRSLSLKAREDRRLRAGHLWIFSNEVDVEKTPLKDFAPGEAANVLDAGGRCLGTALVNPASLICARLVSREADQPLDAPLLRRRLRAALELRERLFEAPFYRLCHGEGDFLPGLTADRYGDALAVQIGTAGMEARKDVLLEELCALLRPSCILLRNDIPTRRLEGLPLEVENALGAAPEILDVPENGAVFAVPFARGQKTGWFYDQRRNRAEAARHAGGRRVLDAFCYVGGFGVAAARNGAAEVTFLDASAPALERAMDNLRRNAPHCPGEVLEDDAMRRMTALRQSGRRFDMVCVDPPAFIKRRKDMAVGLAAYKKLNALALDLLEPGGVLVSSSCSHHLEFEALRQCAARAGVRRGMHGQWLWQGAQEPDHPIHAAMPETSYLKCVVARFQG